MEFVHYLINQVLVLYSQEFTHVVEIVSHESGSRMSISVNSTKLINALTGEVHPSSTEQETLMSVAIFDYIGFEFFNDSPGMNQSSS